MATAQLFKALADPARVKIFNMLARSEEPVCACEFVPALGLAQATVSHHLEEADAGRACSSGSSVESGRTSP